MKEKEYFKSYGLILTDYQWEQFENYFTFLSGENEKYNLTAITEREDVYTKHFLDSLLITKLKQSHAIDIRDKRIIDIGSGAGFPGVPIKIYAPSTEMVCLDSLNKRVKFLDQLTQNLYLDKIVSIHGRAEDFGQDKKYREQFDIAVSRAVAELRLLLEFCMPFVKKNGYFIAYKSLKSNLELDQAGNALKVLNTSFIGQVSIELPNEKGNRDLLIFQKNGNIQRTYPRKAGIPKKAPL